MYVISFSRWTDRRGRIGKLVIIFFLFLEGSPFVQAYLLRKFPREPSAPVHHKVFVRSRVRSEWTEAYLIIFSHLFVKTSQSVFFFSRQMMDQHAYLDVLRLLHTDSLKLRLELCRRGERFLVFSTMTMLTFCCMWAKATRARYYPLIVRLFYFLEFCFLVPWYSSE